MNETFSLPGVFLLTPQATRREEFDAWPTALTERVTVCVFAPRCRRTNISFVVGSGRVEIACRALKCSREEGLTGRRAGTRSVPGR